MAGQHLPTRLRPARHPQRSRRALRRGRARKTAATAWTRSAAQRSGQIIERDETLSEAITPSPSSQDQRHRSGRNRTVVVTYQSLQHPRVCRPRSELRPQRGSAPHPLGATGRHQRGVIQQARRDQSIDNVQVAFIVRRCGCRWAVRPATRQRYRPPGNAPSSSSMPVPARSSGLRDRGKSRPGSSSAGRPAGRAGAS